MRRSGAPGGRNTLRTETGLLFQLPDKSKTGNTSTSASTTATNTAAKNSTAPKKEVKQDDKPRDRVGGVRIVPPATRTIVIEPPTKPQIIPPLRREVIIEPPTKKAVILDGDMPRVVVNVGKMTRSVIVQTDEEIDDLNKSRRGTVCLFESIYMTRYNTISIIVPKSARPATKSLNIRNFVKPFEELEVRRFLEKYGDIDYFWLEGNQCFVTVS